MCVVIAVRVFLLVLFFAAHQCSECPARCECFAVTRTVKCVSENLHVVPQSFPGYVRTIIITGNNIPQIGADSFVDLENVTNFIFNNNRVTEVASHSFSSLFNLRLLDLSGNVLSLIHPEAFSITASPLQELNLSHALYNSSALADLSTALRWGSLGSLLSLDLSGNRLAFLQSAMFSYLPSLRQLFLSHNSLVSLPAGIFSGLTRLQELDLSHNKFRTLRAEDLQELAGLGDLRLLLGHNPYSCSCDIRPLVAWLNESRARVDVDALRCCWPRALNHSRLWGLSPQALGCEGPAEVAGTDVGLQTSYVFLGVVLGLVGVVFLFVLYLNRKGMKLWIVEMRDACRDVMEGYHYRYEIDSDPRLGHISVANGDRRIHMQVDLNLSQQLPVDTCITQVPTKTLVKSRTSQQPLNL